MASYGIGIDTGGTYTDAVLIKLDDHAVVRAVKEATTHHDLSLGVGRAIIRLLREAAIEAGAVDLLAVSTTLATNAVVEGHGARVGLFVIGYVKHFKLPLTVNVFLKGGHDVLGREEQPLDMEGLVDMIGELRGEVDGYALCSAMSMHNPAHELVAEEAIRLIDPKPVFCSHRISSETGMRERAATAALHARLMPVMEDFLAGVGRSVQAAGIGCPITVIRGDATPVGVEEVVRRAAVTMASGPAATAAFGARHASGRALVVDVGGTTTDVAMIRDGRLVLDEQGCRIGEWQTQVLAVDMYTAGVGGDSEVVVRERDRGIELRPARVRPLAMVKGLPDPEGWIGYDRRAACVLLEAGLDMESVTGDEVLGFLAARGPATEDEIGRSTMIRGVPLEKKLERLAFLQQVSLCGFTPTDALHVLGRIDIGDRAQSLSGARRLAGLAGLEMEDFCLRVLALGEEKVEDVILEYLLRHAFGQSQAAFLNKRRCGELVDVAFTAKLPIIGIGAAAPFLLPGVAAHLGTTVHFPEHYEVGNAIGAVLIARREADPEGTTEK